MAGTAGGGWVRSQNLRDPAITYSVDAVAPADRWRGPPRHPFASEARAVRAGRCCRSAMSIRRSIDNDTATWLGDLPQPTSPTTTDGAATALQSPANRTSYENVAGQGVAARC